jgi:hypothetical protein
MGYDTEMVDNPPDSKVQSHIQSTTTAMFYELAHGSAYSFHNICPDSESITWSEVETWISGYSKMPFTFLGSCGGMCDTAHGSLSYAFRKGSTIDTTSVGYCGMAESYCATCWSYSIEWQTILFMYMNDPSYTVYGAYNQAMALYPVCAPTEGACMRFAGDTTFKVKPVVERGTQKNPCCNTGPYGVGGCIDPDIEAAVCAEDPYCCATRWDSICVGEVESVYGDNCDCCEFSSQAEGCYRPGPDPMVISDCVCVADPYCCTVRWDYLCVNHVESLSCGCCAPGTPTSPLPKDGATGVPLDATLSWGGSGAAAPGDINPNETVASGIVDPDSVAPPTAFGAGEREIVRVEIPDEMNPNTTVATEVLPVQPGSDGVKVVADCSCGGKFYTGQQVISLVDDISYSGLPKGSTGTVVCGSSSFPNSILISWDDWSGGHDGNGHCTCPVTSVPDNSGWWVSCDEVGVVAVDCACDGQYATGDRVYATVDNPQGANGILAGHPGRVVCGVSGLPLPILISWDDWSNGHDGNGYCACPVSEAPDNSGWWVLCEDIAKCPVTYDVYFGTTGPTSLICSDISSPSSDPGTLSGNTKYYWSVVAKVPGAETVGPTWSFTTAPAGDPCECDLNSDGSCNGKDWLLFYPDWGRTDCKGSIDPCECDLNNDGACNGKDWLLFYPDWGRTDCP